MSEYNKELAEDLAEYWALETVVPITGTPSTEYERGFINLLEAYGIKLIQDYCEKSQCQSGGG